jgi:hypothetical protein
MLNNIDHKLLDPSLFAYVTRMNAVCILIIVIELCSRNRNPEEVELCKNCLGKSSDYRYYGCRSSHVGFWEVRELADHNASYAGLVCGSQIQ